MVALQLAVKNVFRKRERSFLTIIGVFLAVASFIALLSIAEGVGARFESEINHRDVDIYIMPPDASNLPTGPIGTVGISTDFLPKELFDRVQKFEKIQYVSPIFRIQQKINNKIVIITGISATGFSRVYPGFKLKSGRVFDDNSKEIVVGGSLAAEAMLGEGSSINIGDQQIQVVGVGITGENLQDYFCYMPIDTAMQLKGSAGYHELWIQITDSNRQNREKMAKFLRQMLPEYRIKTREEYLAGANEFVALARLLQLAIAAIGILIATTAAMNTMLMSAYERIKEFGTLRSIGAGRFTVSLMIFAESMILSLTGGFAGIVLGMMGSKVLDETLRALFQLSFPLAKITMSLIFYGFTLSVIIGIAGAIVPAVIIYRMNIIDSLRWE